MSSPHDDAAHDEGSPRGVAEEAALLREALRERGGLGTSLAGTLLSGLAAAQRSRHDGSGHPSGTDAAHPSGRPHASEGSGSPQAADAAGHGSDGGGALRATSSGDGFSDRGSSGDGFATEGFTDATTSGECTCGGTTPRTCRSCPMCLAISVARSVRPETLERAADVVMLAVTALRDLAEHRRDEQASAERTGSERAGAEPTGAERVGAEQPHDEQGTGRDA